MKKIFTTSALITKSLMILVLMLSLINVGAFSLERTLNQIEKIEQPDIELIIHDILSQDNKPLEEKSKNMADGGIPCTEQPAILSSAVSVISSNSNIRNKINNSEKLFNCTNYPIAISNTILINNSNMVSTQLGRQFTLVGAKPSGTS